MRAKRTLCRGHKTCLLVPPTHGLQDRHGGNPSERAELQSHKKGSRATASWNINHPHPREPDGALGPVLFLGSRVPLGFTLRDGISYHRFDPHAALGRGSHDGLTRPGLVERTFPFWRSLCSLGPRSPGLPPCQWPEGTSVRGLPSRVHVGRDEGT